MRVGHSYKQIELRGPFDVIVVGSGVGGLTCAALLARHAGKRVLVLERHYTAGGFTHSFERPGYDWDVGVHYVGGMLSSRSPLRMLFDHITDGELAWADLGEVYDVIDIAGEQYEFRRGREPFRERMHAYFPRERKIIDEYLALTRRLNRFSEAFFADRAMPSTLARLAAPLLRVPVNAYARKTTAQVFRELGASQRLMAVLTGNFGDYGLPPSRSSFFMQALLAEHYRHGAAYPVGGASRIAATIIPSIERAGGAVVTSAPVAEILVQGNRAVGVRLENGDEWHAPIVVSDAGARITFERLLSPDARARMGLREPLAGLSPSVSSVTLYLGFEGSAEELRLPKHNIWIYPHDDYDRALAWAEGGRTPPSNDPLPLTFCSFAAARDPLFEHRHPGHSTAEVITVSDYRWFQRWHQSKWQKRGADYEELKREWTERLLEPLLTRLPQLRDRIRHAELSTPLSTRHFASHLEGEIYGLAHGPERFIHPRLRAATPVRNLYLAGADVVTCGVAGAASGGLLAAARILADRPQTLLRRKQTRMPGYVPRARNFARADAAAE